VWYPSRHDSRKCGSRPTKRRAARASARRLLFEGLEPRALLAFNLLAEYATGPSPQSMLLSHIDTGSQVDLVVVNSNNSISVRLGNGDGKFGDGQGSPTGTGARAAVAGDFTSDGVTDLVTANSNDLSLLVGNGDGSFQPPQSTALNWQQPPSSGSPLPQNATSVATGDLNGDGTLDLAVAGYTVATYCPYYCYITYDGYVNVLLGNGSGEFDSAQMHHLGTSRIPNAVAIADINGDTNADVMTANSFTSGLSVLLGDGSGAVGSPIHSGSGSPLRSISLGDVDGDGNLDTITSGVWGLTVQKGDGLGGFTPLSMVSTGSPVDSAVIGDVNADGKLDLVATGAANSFTCTSGGYYGCYSGYYTSTRHAAVLLGNGGGSFAIPLASSLGGAPHYGLLPDLVLADLTGDGLPELATVAAYAAKAIIATNDGDWHPPAAISISDAAVTEGDGGSVTAVFTVTVIGEHSGVSVDYATSDFTALVDADYTLRTGTLTFAANETSQQIEVPILDDTTDEYDEQFFVALFNGVGGQTTDATGIGTIEDNDDAPLVTISDISVVEGHRDPLAIALAVNLSAVSGKHVYVEFSTADGTATLADNDYGSAAGAVYLAPGVLTTNLWVDVLGDRRIEPNETFYVNLTGAEAATISDGQGQATIVNDDTASSPPAISIRDASIVEGNSGSRQMTFTVYLSHGSNQKVRVKYRTANGTAKTGNNDYVGTSGTITFAAGETVKTITVTVRGDKKEEGDEYFHVNLSSANDGEIDDGQAVGTIFNDDGVSARGNQSFRPTRWTH